MKERLIREIQELYYPTKSIQTIEYGLDFRKLIAKLTEKQLAVYLWYLSGYSVSEIAFKMDMNKSTVSRTMEKIKEICN